MKQKVSDRHWVQKFVIKIKTELRKRIDLNTDKFNQKKKKKLEIIKKAQVKMNTQFVR